MLVFTLRKSILAFVFAKWYQRQSVKTCKPALVSLLTDVSSMVLLPAQDTAGGRKLHSPDRMIQTLKSLNAKVD